MVLNLAECFLGTKPMGDTWKLGSGGLWKRPATCPKATSLVAAPVFRPFLRHVCVTDFCAGALRFVMLSPTRSDARARNGVSFYLFPCRFPVFLYTNCTSVYLVWQIPFFRGLEMYYAYWFVIKAMIICSSQMGVLDFGLALAYPWKGFR